MKQITLAFWVAITLFMSPSAFAQQAWVKLVEIEKHFTQSGSIFSFVKQMDGKNTEGNLSLYGHISRIAQYNNYGNTIIQNYTDSNSLRRVNGQWRSAGKMTFGNSHSAIYTHDTILGKEYIGVGKNDSTGKLYAAFNVLDASTNNYVPVGNLRFTGKVSGFVYLGNQKVLILGDFYEASDGFTTQIFYGVALYDFLTKKLEKMPDNCAVGDCGLGGSYFHHSVGNDGTLMVTTGSGSRSHYKKGSGLSWEDNLFPGNFSGGRFIKSLVVSQDTVYAAWQKDSTGYPCYLLKFIRSQGMLWQVIGRLTGTYTPTSIRTTWVNSIHQKKDGTLLVATEATHWNGQAVGNNVVSINPVTGAHSALPIVPTMGQYFGSGRLEIVQDKTYFIEGVENVFSDIQEIHILRDTTARLAPTITTVGTQLASPVVVQGTVPEPRLFIDIHNATTGVLLQSVQSNQSGSWSSTLSLNEGVHTLYARARNEDSIYSPFSTPVHITVDTCAKTLVTTIPIVNGAVVQSPVVLSGNASEPNSYIGIRFRNEGEQRVATDLNTDNSWSLTTPRPLGPDTVYITPIDSVGHRGITQMRVFTVSTATAVVDRVQDPDAPRIFPNPSHGTVTITNTIRIVRIVSMNGVALSYRVAPQGSSLRVVLHEARPGLYVVEGERSNGSRFTQTLLVQ